MKEFKTNTKYFEIGWLHSLGISIDRHSEIRAYDTEKGAVVEVNGKSLPELSDYYLSVLCKAVHGIATIDTLDLIDSYVLITGDNPEEEYYFYIDKMASEDREEFRKYVPNLKGGEILLVDEHTVSYNEKEYDIPERLMKELFKYMWTCTPEGEGLNSQVDILETGKCLVYSSLLPKKVAESVKAQAASELPAIIEFNQCPTGKITFTINNKVYTLDSSAKEEAESMLLDRDTSLDDIKEYGVDSLEFVKFNVGDLLPNEASLLSKITGTIYSKDTSGEITEDGLEINDVTYNITPNQIFKLLPYLY